MGNPLGPTLANAFLSHHEVEWLRDCPISFKPLLYRRYVDDTFLAFRSQEHIPLFLEYLNSKHPNIEFTSEKENDGNLPFLDILVSRQNDHSFKTSIYRKPTFTGLTTKFSSFIPILYKRNLIATLVTRAFNVCSDYFSFHSEFQFLRQILNNNGFCKYFIDSYIGKQLEKLMSPKLEKSTVNRAVLYFPITFTGKNSFSLKNKLTRLLREFYPQIIARVIFKPRYTIGSFFRFKDVVPTEMQASAIYKYKCNCCNAIYVGQTKRHVRVRWFEHLGKSIRTNRPLANPSFSAIRQHAHDNDHPIHLASFSILSIRLSTMELPTVESLYTIREKRSLNNNDQSVDLICF